MMGSTLQTIAVSLVRNHLEIGQERGYMLHLVNNGTLVELGEKSPGI